jgi:hypothetical protein
MSAEHPTKPDYLRREKGFEEIGMPRVIVIEVVVKLINFLENSAKEKIILVRGHRGLHHLNLIVIRNRSLWIQFVVLVENKRIIFRPDGFGR